jgi:NAD(P)-dependent dehydrogenase (short-subunit alcohol dehydrogenase family)
MTNRFTARTVIVTGAGSGIGLATVRRLVAEGARVVANDVSPDRIDALLTETAGTGGGVVGVVGDISTQVAVDELLAAADGRVDVLANVAGIMDGVLPPHELDDATWERVLGVNLTGPMRLTRAVLPLMMEAGHGSIVNVASEASLRASSSGAAYTTSKHALIGLTRSTAVFYGHLGIRCNAVCPGAVMTNIGFESRSAFGSEVVARHITTIPTLAEPEEIAASICWLASDDAANVNGAVLAVDGGWSAA